MTNTLVPPSAGEPPVTDDDPASMTPEQRRQEVAAILARGVLRLRRCVNRSPAVLYENRTPGKDSQNAENQLDNLAPIRLHVRQPRRLAEAAGTGTTARTQA